MTAHLHREFVPGCYRCDLSRDEMACHDNYCGFCLACDEPWPCPVEIASWTR